MEPLRLEDRKGEDSQTQALHDIEGEVKKEEGEGEGEEIEIDEEDATLFRQMEQCMDNFRQARAV